MADEGLKELADLSQRVESLDRELVAIERTNDMLERRIIALECKVRDPFSRGDAMKSIPIPAEFRPVEEAGGDGLFRNTVNGKIYNMRLFTPYTAHLPVLGGVVSREMILENLIIVLDRPTSLQGTIVLGTKDSVRAVYPLHKHAVLADNLLLPDYIHFGDVVPIWLNSPLDVQVTVEGDELEQRLRPSGDFLITLNRLESLASHGRMTLFGYAR